MNEIRIKVKELSGWLQKASSHHPHIAMHQIIKELALHWYLYSGTKLFLDFYWTKLLRAENATKCKTVALNCRTHLSQLVVKVRWWDWKRAYSFTGILKKKILFMLLFLMIVYSQNVTASWKVMFSALAPFFKNKTKKWWGQGKVAARSCEICFVVKYIVG